MGVLDNFLLVPKTIPLPAIPANKRANRKQAVQLGLVFVFNNQKFNFSG